MQGRVLIVAGSDSAGGAGIQADIKAVTMLGGYAATAVTALTVQNTLGVSDVLAVPPAFVAAQMRSVLDDIGADAIKIGMLAEVGVVKAVTEVIAALPRSPSVVIDPVMVAKGGARLLDEAAVSAMTERLLPLAALLTPNIPEAEALTGLAIDSVIAARKAGEKLVERGAAAVLVKGGHLEGDEVVDWLITFEHTERFASPRIHTRHTHGTGCTLASAIACGLAQGMELGQAVARARDYVHAAIRAAPGFGRGHGPLGHNYIVRHV